MKKPLILLPFFFYFFFSLFFSFSVQAKSLQSNINQPYGLFLVEANKLEEEKEIFAAPTLKTDVHVDVQGLLTTTTVKQYFINPSNTWMEAIYLFPLPDKSAVDFLRMKIGERFIEGEIQEKVEAEKIYEKAKKNGNKASLVSSSRANIFKTKVANIAPGEMIIIEIRYHDIITLKNDIYSLRIPTVINHRYTHSKKVQEGDIISEAAELNPEIHSPINLSLDFTVNPYSISIDLNTGFDITIPESAFHSISVDSVSSSHHQITLADGKIPSTRDFVLNFSPIKSPEPYIEIYGEDIGRDLYLYGLINPQIEQQDLTLMDKTAITIVADVSGSMMGNSLRQMQGALIAFINQLPEHHYINIIAFDDRHYKLFNVAEPATESTKQLALKFVHDMEADNGTNMLPPIYEAILEKPPLFMKQQVVLMTDGSIDYEKEIMAIIHEHIGDKRFHVVGIGSAPNSFLIKGMAKAGRGSYLYVDGNFKEKIKELLFKINRPVLEDLSIEMIRKHDILPKKLPDILADEPITFFMKIPDARMVDLIKPFSIRGNKRNTEWKFSVAPDQIQKGKNLDQLWAREKVADLSFRYTIGSMDVMEYEQQVRDLGLTHNLITKFTSLVAVDQVTSYDKSSPLLSHQIPQNIPDGWEDPEILKQTKKMQQHLKQLNQEPIETLYKVSLNTEKALKVNFVQTSTNKNLFLLLAIFLLLGSFYLFKIQRRMA